MLTIHSIITFLFRILFFQITVWDVHSTIYCPPLTAPPNTNITCITSGDDQLVDCSSTWLPDKSIAYFRCTKDSELKVEFGKIVCKGNYEMINNKLSKLNNNEDEDPALPCGIQQMPYNSEFHFYGYEKSPHYPVLMNVTEDSDFQAGGLQLLNYFRQQHQVSPLELDELLSERAQLWADTLAVRNNLDLAKENFVGQNVFNSDQTELTLAVNDAIQFWYLQGKAEYNWEDIKSNWENTLALDFSQIVWKSTRKFGLGASTRKSSHGKGTVVVAFYFPMGNVVLESETQPDKMFIENVLKTTNLTSEMH